MIKNFIFDFGNVLTKYDFIEYAMNFTNDRETAETVFQYTFHSPEWKKYDAGDVSEDEVIALLKSHAPEKYHDGIDKLVRTFEKAFVQYDDMLPVLKKLKEKGYRTFLLSNFPKGKYEQVAEHCPILDYIDDIVVSYKIHLVKPNRDIYEYVLNTFGLTADECLFADDAPYCIDGACKVGIHGHVFTTADEYIKCIKNLGVNLDV